MMKVLLIDNLNLKTYLADVSIGVSQGTELKFEQLGRVGCVVFSTFLSF